MEKNKEDQAYLKHQKKLIVLEYAKRSESVANALKEFNVPKQPTTSGKKLLIKTELMACYESILWPTIIHVKSMKK